MLPENVLLLLEGTYCRRSSGALLISAIMLDTTTPQNLLAVAAFDRYHRNYQTGVAGAVAGTMGNTLRALLVDFYGTLVRDDDVVVARICSDVAAELGGPVMATEVARQWSGTFVAECEAAFGPHRRQREVARSSLGDCPQDAWLHRGGGRAPRCSVRLLAAPRAVGDARRFLDGLGVPACVVSNIDRVNLEAATACYALEFDHVVTSEDIRAYKPRPEIFERALKLLGVHSKEAVNVGDSLTADVDSLTADVGGATRAGLRRGRVNGSGRRRPAGAEPWAEVEGLHQLAGMLADA